MKTTKRFLAVLLAAMLLFSALPMTAFAVETEVAATGAYSVSTGDELFKMLSADNVDADEAVIINVTADISYYVTTPGDSSDNSYLRYACTIGQGKKVLNLNGHQLHFYNDYSVIVNHTGASVDDIEGLNRQCLFEIPLGAELTVNGDSGSASGLIQYHGKLLDKCDAVDQRDIFDINGGCLTINSGQYLAGGEVTSYTWQDSIEILPGITDYYDVTGWYVVGGTAIRGIAGELTVNGGYFQGRGFASYNTRYRNCALLIANMRSVVINDGHFVGSTKADVIHNGAGFDYKKYKLKGGTFELDLNDTYLNTVYHSFLYSNSFPGAQHMFIPNPSNYTLIKRADYGLDGIKTREVTYEELDEDPLALYEERPKYIYVSPRSGLFSLSGETTQPTQEVEFYYGGKKYKVSEDDVTWNKISPLKLTIDPDSLYYSADNYGSRQTVSATFDLLEYYSEGHQPEIATEQDITFTLGSDGLYTADLNSISSTVKSKMLEDHTYVFKFSINEYWNGERAVKHTGYFYVDTTKKIGGLYFKINAPEYGKKVSEEVTNYFSDECDVTLSWLYQSDGSSSWLTLNAGQAFQYGNKYRAVFMVTAKEGYTIDDDVKVMVNGEQIDSGLVYGTGLMTNAEYDLHVDPIEEIEIINVPKPESGQTPVYSANVPDGVTYSPSGHYFIDPQMSMTWYDEDGFSMDKTDTFKGGKQYTLKMQVWSYDGYVFSSDPAAYVNGFKAKVTETWTDFTGVGHARVEYTFTCPKTVTGIDGITVHVPVPTPGEELGYTAEVPAKANYAVEDFSSGDTWKNGVKWVDENGDDLPIGTVVEAGKKYKVWVSVEVNDPDQYYFADADMISARVNGAEATVYDYDEHNYGVMFTFEVPEASAKQTIDSVNVTVSAPEAGEKLSYTASVPDGKGYEVEDYDGEGTWLDGVCWQKPDGAAFEVADYAVAEAGEEYVASVSVILSDESAYEFADSLTVTINGEAAEYYFYGSNNVVIYRAFTAQGGSAEPTQPGETPTEPVVPVGKVLLGDADGDGEVTILDATIIQRKLVDLPVTKYVEAASDADQDYEVSILDATAIQRHLVSLSSNENIGKYISLK